RLRTTSPTDPSPLSLHAALPICARAPSANVTAEPLVLVGKPGCHLCEVMREVVSPVAAELGLALAERDVRSDPELDALYRNDIPDRKSTRLNSSHGWSSYAVFCL